MSLHLLPVWYQLRCSGSSSTATSRLAEVMYELTSPTGMMEYLSLIHI